MKSQTSSKIGNLGSKTRSLGQILEKPCVRSRGHIFESDYHETWSEFVLMKCGTSLKMGHVGLKTRSLGQILENLCVCSRGQIFSPIIANIGQYFVLMKSQRSSKMGHVRSKTWSSHRKTLCTLQRLHFQFNNHETWSECLS